MLDHPLPDIDAWVLLFSNNSLPVLRTTQRQLDALRENIDNVNRKELARLILHDPVMTARVLAYAQSLHGKSLQHDITTVSSALAMSGMEPFFQRFSELISIEAMLKGEDPHALLGVVQTIRRAQRAAEYARDWAIWRHDINMEEVHLAALLHDLAEILVSCFAPRLALQIRARQQARPGLRSADAQREVLGFSYHDIQLALCRVWHLPPLLEQLIDDDNKTQIRVRNVSLAVRLARHSASGWEDPALPDDFREIGELLNLTPEAVRQHLGLEPLPAREADGEAGHNG